MKKDVIVLDTNIWISFLLSRKFHILTSIILDNKLDVVTCHNLEMELKDVLLRKKFSKLISKRDINEAINIHVKLCRYVEVQSKSNLLTDKKDNYLVDLYLSSGATILVTGDKQLLEQAPLFGLKVLTLKQFEEQVS